MADQVNSYNWKETDGAPFLRLQGMNFAIQDFADQQKLMAWDARIVALDMRTYRYQVRRLQYNKPTRR